ncbi:MAG: hypothetical protein KDD58_06820 [Bdellovibrionales bacterium]|nr:hypothetical protein [Bdellovibrionales bacterium]
MLDFLKVFFPKWNFFNTFNHLPILQYKSSTSEVWIDVFPELERSELSFLLNPSVNYHYACSNHLFTWLQELKYLKEPTVKDIEQTLSYKITEKIVSFELRKNQSIERFQFRLLLRSPITENEDIIFISRVIQCN